MSTTDEQSPVNEEPRVTGKSNTQTAEAVDLVIEPTTAEKDRLSALVARQTESGIRGQGIAFMQHGLQQSERLFDENLNDKRKLQSDLETLRTEFYTIRELNVRLRAHPESCMSYLPASRLSMTRDMQT